MWRLASLLALVTVASGQLTLDGPRCGQFTCNLEEYCSPEINRCAPCSVACNKTHHNYDSGLCVKECQGYLLDLRYMRRSEAESPPPADVSTLAHCHDLNPFPSGRDPTRLSNQLSSPIISTNMAGRTKSCFKGVQRQAQIALIISGVALAVLLVVLVIVCRGRLSWRYIKQRFQPSKNRVKQNPHDLTHYNPHAEIGKPRPDLKLDIRNPEPPKRNPQPLNVRDLETRTSQTEKSQGATTPKTISTALSNRHPAEDTTLDFSYDNMGMNVTPPEQPAVSHKF